MTDYFELMKGITREHVRKLEDLPIMDPQEHAWLEFMVGRKLDNQEAQLLMHDVSMFAAYSHWIDGKKAD